MQISGQMRTACPPSFLMTVLRNPDAMIQLLPKGSELAPAGDGTYKFTLIQTVGPIRLTLPGTIEMAPGDEDGDLQLTVRAAHMIAGKVNMDLLITLSQPEEHTRIIYDGQLAATGLAGRILNEHKERANGVVKASMTRLRLYAERAFAKVQAGT
jgi:carbon monoxide dehydrogenase subunit G